MYLLEFLITLDSPGISSNGNHLTQHPKWTVNKMDPIAVGITNSGHYLSPIKHYSEE